MEGSGRKRVKDSRGHRDIRFDEGLVRFLSNLTDKECWTFENRGILINRALGRIIDFSSSGQTS